MATWGMVIDLDRCTGCQACTMACKAENNVPAVGREEADKERVISWMQVLAEPDEEHEGEVKRFLPRPCMQCEDPPCTKVCPVYATYKNPEGIVAQIYGRCIGCRFCMAACPYNAKFFNWHEYQHPSPGQNPDVSLRPKGVVEKCTFCHHRLQKVREQAAVEKRRQLPGEYNTACAEACPAQAISFGDLADPTSEVARLSRSPRAFRLLESLGTRPKVIYLTEGEGRG
jgi:menaquinone reductase, iron-sulfur cluster-binding subunit